MLAIGDDVGFCCRREAVRKTARSGGMNFPESNRGNPYTERPTESRVRLCGPAQIGTDAVDSLRVIGLVGLVGMTM